MNSKISFFTIETKKAGESITGFKNYKEYQFTGEPLSVSTSGLMN
jgi:hypothetical protein